MKRTTTILSIAAALLGIAGNACTDPTVAPKSTVSSETVFNDPNSYRAFLAKIYGGLIVTGQRGPDGNPDIAGIDEGFGEYLRLYWYLQEMPTDEAVIGWNDPGLPDLNTGLWGTDNSMVNAMYYRVFYQVMLVNEFLRQSTDAKLDSRRQTDATLRTNVHYYRAEARFLRALSYWHGIDLFGNIPLVTENDPLGATPPQDGANTQTWGGMTFLIHAGCGGSMSAANYGVDYCWGGYRLKQQAYRLFGAGDTRASFFYTTGQTDSVADRGTFSNGIAAPKFANKTSGGANGAQSGMVDTDFPIFRLADAYLIYVEANVRGGSGSAATALGYLNLIRERAYGNTTHDFAALPPADTILAERARELLYEAQRRSDLVRFGKFTGSSYLWAWKGGDPGGVALDVFRDLYPLPANELIANPNLQQNPGY